MNAYTKKAAPEAMVILAFATVYLVWGSTYFFIQKAVAHIPPFLMGAMRFVIAGTIMLVWCIIKGEKIWNPELIKHAAVTGLLLLFIGNGSVIWAEQALPSSLVAVLISAAPIWFVILDKPKWRENFKSRSTVIGLVIGFSGVLLLFSDRISQVGDSGQNSFQMLSLIIIVVGMVCWAGGSLYSKYKSIGSATVNSAWQMLIAGIVFIPSSFISGEYKNFHPADVTTESWLSLLYLIIMGSLAAYSAYVWLLQVRPATQVSTYGYVNPVVAVLLGVFFANEHMGGLQILGLAIILISVLLINLAKYKKEKEEKSAAKAAQLMAESALVD
ncbi:EamA family transporter [Chitinophagaceae bacterium LWZ2-11]